MRMFFLGFKHSNHYNTMCMVTMLGGDLYLHSWGLTCSNPIWSWNLKHTAWISEWSWPISWYFRWIHDTGWRFQSSSGVLVLFFVTFHPRSWLSKSLRLWRNQANHRHWDQWSQRVAVDANHLRRRYGNPGAVKKMATKNWSCAMRDEKCSMRMRQIM